MDEQDCGFDIKPRNGRRKIKNLLSPRSSSTSSSPGSLSMDQANCIIMPSNEQDIVSRKCSKFVDAFNKMIASYPQRREELLLLKHHLPFHEKLDGMIQQLEELRRSFVINGSSNSEMSSKKSSPINGQAKVSLKNHYHYCYKML